MKHLATPSSWAPPIYSKIGMGHAVVPLHSFLRDYIPQLVPHWRDPELVEKVEWQLCCNAF